MYYIQQRCEEYGCTDLIGITDQSERSDLVERPSLGGIGAEVKRDEEYDVGVEKLGYDRRAGSPEPHIFIACGHFELLENECIEQLGNHESRHGTEDDHHAGSEYPAVGCIDIGFYILIDIYPEIGGGGSGSQQHDHKGIGNHAQSDPGKQAHTPFPEVFIDDISHDEYDRPDDGAGGEIQRDMFDPEERPVHRLQSKYPLERENFGADYFSNDGITYKEAGEYHEEFVFFTEPSHTD